MILSGGILILSGGVVILSGCIVIWRMYCMVCYHAHISLSQRWRGECELSSNGSLTMIATLLHTYSAYSIIFKSLKLFPSFNTASHTFTLYSLSTTFIYCTPENHPPTNYYSYCYKMGSFFLYCFLSFCCFKISLLALNLWLNWLISSTIWIT